MRKAIRLVSAIMLAFVIVQAIFNIPSAVLMLMDLSSYTSDLITLLPTLTQAQVEQIMRTYAILTIVESGFGLLGMWALVYLMKNAFVESFKGAIAIRIAIACFIFLYFPVAIITLIYGIKTKNEKPNIIEG